MGCNVHVKGGPRQDFHQRLGNKHHCSGSSLKKKKVHRLSTQTRGTGIKTCGSWAAGIAAGLALAGADPERGLDLKFRIVAQLATLVKGTSLA